MFRISISYGTDRRTEGPTDGQET